MPAPCRFRGLFWKAARIGVLFSLLLSAAAQNVALIGSCSSKSTRSWNSLDWDWCRRTVEPLGRSVLHRHGGGHSRDMRAQPRAGAASNDSHSRSRGRPERPPQHRLRRRSCTRLHVAGLPPARPHYGRLRAAGFRQKWRSPPSVGHWIAWLRGC